VTVPLSETFTACSGMVSRMWSGVVPEKFAEVLQKAAS
jgi:hypothetical protein